MAPADQALHAHNSPVQALLWLVVQFKLVAGDGHLQVVLQLHALVDGDLHLRIKKHRELRPCDFTWYMAMSACLSKSTVGCMSCPMRVAPMLGCCGTCGHPANRAC